MRARMLLTIGELGLGIVVGFITYMVSGERGTLAGILSVAVGLLTSLLAATLSQQFAQAEQNQKSDERLDRLISGVSERLLGSADAASALRYGGVEVPRADVTKVWLDRLWRTSTRYWGVIYTAPDEVVDTNVFQLGVAVLSAKVKVDQVDVRRIFLVDTQNELEHIAATMHALQDNQINVRYALRSNLENNPRIRVQLAELRSLDFTVMDSFVVWQLLIDKARRIRAGSLHFDERMNAKYAEVFRLLWDASTPVTPALPGRPAAEMTRA
ncbi:MAG TPA: hypothetical protein VGD27_00450 [Longimicrobiales bacterium]